MYLPSTGLGCTIFYTVMALRTSQCSAHRYSCVVSSQMPLVQFEWTFTWLIYIKPVGACHRHGSARALQKRIDWLIDWGLTPFLTISQSYHGSQFTYSCVSWFSHTSTPHNNLPKQLAAFPHRLSPSVEEVWRMSQWLVKRRKESWPSQGFELTTPGLTACVVTDKKEKHESAIYQWKIHP